MVGRVPGIDTLQRAPRGTVRLATYLADECRRSRQELLQDSMRRLPPGPRILLHLVAHSENPELPPVSNDDQLPPANPLVN